MRRQFWKEVDWYLILIGYEDEEFMKEIEFIEEATLT